MNRWKKIHRPRRSPWRYSDNSALFEMVMVRGFKTSSMLNSPEHEIPFTNFYIKITRVKKILLTNIHVIMPKIWGVLIFISKMYFILCWAELEKKFNKHGAKWIDNLKKFTDLYCISQKTSEYFSNILSICSYAMLY